MRLTVLAGLVAALAAGCGDTKYPVGTVSGTATYDGKPVVAGYVQFTPKDGKRPVVGTRITDGQYKIDGVPAGPCVLFVSADGSPSQAGPISTEELGRQAAERKNKPPPPQPVEIPATAQGNNATVEVKEGKNTVNLDLKSPK